MEVFIILVSVTICIGSFINIAVYEVLINLLAELENELEFLIETLKNK